MRPRRKGPTVRVRKRGAGILDLVPARGFRRSAKTKSAVHRSGVGSNTSGGREPLTGPFRLRPLYQSSNLTSPPAGRKTSSGGLNVRRVREPHLSPLAPCLWNQQSGVPGRYSEQPCERKISASHPALSIYRSELRSS